MSRRHSCLFESWLCDNKYFADAQGGEIPADGVPATPWLFMGGDSPADAWDAFQAVALVVALGLGTIGDFLLRPAPVGLNLPVWLGLVAAAALVLARGRGVVTKHNTLAFLVVALIFGLTFVWRNAPALKALNAVAIAAALALAMASVRPFRAATAHMAEYARRLLEAAGTVALGAVSLLPRDWHWERFAGGHAARHAVASLRGVLIAIPALVVFTWLFASADAAFLGLLESLVDIQWQDAFQHTAVCLVCAWVASGMLKGLVDGPPEKLKPVAGMPAPSLGAVEAGVFMGLINLLFLVFVLVQVGYFFGGEDRIQAVEHLTYAEYARRGFFELCAVAVLVLPMQFGLDWLLRQASATGKRAFRGLALVQLALLVVIMASALQRMRLYVDAYGLTVLRLYSTACMIWLAFVFIWFVATVLRGRRERFALGVIASGWVALFALNACNPDAVILRVNLARMEAGKPFDAHYARRLSADAVPAFALAAERYEVEERVPWDSNKDGPVLLKWVVEFVDEGPPDIRMWDWGLHRARQVVQEHLPPK
jgi:Domain of unknown function (DUF4153)